MTRPEALALAVVALQVCGDDVPGFDWDGACATLTDMLKEERRRAKAPRVVGNKSAAVEAEFGEPIQDTIVGMRAQGCTWRTVAGSLGVSLNTLIEWRKKLGLPIQKNSNIWDALSYEDRQLNGRT